MRIAKNGWLIFSIVILHARLHKYMHIYGARAQGAHCCDPSGTRSFHICRWWWQWQITKKYLVFLLVRRERTHTEPFTTTGGNIFETFGDNVTCLLAVQCLRPKTSQVNLSSRNHAVCFKSIRRDVHVSSNRCKLIIEASPTWNELKLMPPVGTRRSPVSLVMKVQPLDSSRLFVAYNAWNEIWRISKELRNSESFGTT